MSTHIAFGYCFHDTQVTCLSFGKAHVQLRNRTKSSENKTASYHGTIAFRIFNDPSSESHHPPLQIIPNPY
jgi:hypothetical protein